MSVIRTITGKLTNLITNQHSSTPSTASEPMTDLKEMNDTKCPWCRPGDSGYTLVVDESKEFLRVFTNFPLSSTKGLVCLETDTGRIKTLLGKYDGEKVNYSDIPYNDNKYFQDRINRQQEYIQELRIDVAALRCKITELNDAIKNLETKTKGMWYHIQEFFRCKR